MNGRRGNLNISEEMTMRNEKTASKTLIKRYAKRFLEYINASPTAFQSADFLSRMLDEAGARRLDAGDKWELEPGKMYYFVSSGTQLGAFRVGAAPLAEAGFRIAAAHHDSPGLRIKPAGSANEEGYEKVLVEGYGSPIVHTWLDRPLGIAGRVCLREGDAVKNVNINIRRPVLCIPSLAIHYDRGVNSEGAKFNLQTEMSPVLCAAQEKPRFLGLIAAAAGAKPEDVLSFELVPYDCQPACFTGASEEFISTPRADDAQMAYTAVSALCEASETDNTCIVMAYDHEEIGSNSNRGANGNALQMTASRICAGLGLSGEDMYRAFAHGMLFSADMSHATHPSYASKTDPAHKVLLNKGPVLKLAARQSYATSPAASAAFKMLAEKNGIPYQVFINRSDAPGGGTIGPGLSARHGLVTADVGNPCLAMHSVREFVGADDVYYMTELMRALFESDLRNII